MEILKKIVGPYLESKAVTTVLTLVVGLGLIAEFGLDVNDKGLIEGEQSPREGVQYVWSASKDLFVIVKGEPEAEAPEAEPEAAGPAETVPDEPEPEVVE